jgi:hypothetical protein
MSSADDELTLSSVVSSESSPVSSQDSSGATEIDLERCAAADEALYPDEHSSDEESFDPEHPEDLATENAKLAAEDDPSSGRSDDEESDDSCVVSDENEDLDCESHDACIELAAKVDAFLLESVSGKKSGKKHRRAALCEVICDHYHA